MPTLTLGVLLVTSLVGPPAAPTPSPAGKKALQAANVVAMNEQRTCASDIDDLTGNLLKQIATLEAELEALAEEVAKQQATRDTAQRELAAVDEKITDATAAGTAPTAPALIALQRERTQIIEKRDAAQQAIGTAPATQASKEKLRDELEVAVSSRYGVLRSKPKLRAELRRCIRDKKNQRLEVAIEAETRSFRGAMADARIARCATAICWGPSNRFAFEPLAELPIGKSFSFSRSGLGRYINGNEIQVSFNAGVRFWAMWDWVSVSVYLSKPLLDAAEVITVYGSAHEFSASQVRRPFPGLGVGLFGDLLWLSADFDQLRNGNSGALRAPEFRPNDVVSRTMTFTVAIAPLAGLRNGLGTLRQKQQREKAEAQETAPVEPEPTTTPPATDEPSTGETPGDETPGTDDTPGDETPSDDTPGTDGPAVVDDGGPS